MDKGQLMAHIIEKFDPDDVLEALEITTEELVNAFQDKVELNSYKFIGDDEDGVQ